MKYINQSYAESVYFFKLIRFKNLQDFVRTVEYACWRNYSLIMVEVSVVDVSRRGNVNSVADIWTRNVCMTITTATIAFGSKCSSNRQAVNDETSKTCSQKCPSQRIRAKLI